MRRREALARAAVFVVVVALVVAGAAAVPYVAQDEPEPRTYEEYDTDKLVPERSSVGGVPQPTEAEASGTVVIDDTHSNRYERSEIQPLVAAITDAGYRVEFATGASLPDALDRADAYVVIDPGRRFAESEINWVERFVESGGRVALLGEPTQSEIAGFSIRSVENMMAPLSTQFGIQFGTGYIYNMERHDSTFQNIFVQPSEETALTEGVDRSTVFTATHVSARGGTPLLTGVEGTRSVRNEEPGEYPVAVLSRNEQVLAVGDTTFLSRQNYNVEDNDRFVANIAEFLVSGERTRTISQYPYNVDPDPTIRYTSVDLLEPSQNLADDLRKSGQEPQLRLERGDFAASETDILVTTFEDLRGQDIAGPGTGITVSRNRIAVDGYESKSQGIVVIRAPKDGIDLIIAGDTTATADRGVEQLISDEAEAKAISDRTIVIRTDSVPDGDGTSSDNETIYRHGGPFA